MPPGRKANFAGGAAWAGLSALISILLPVLMFVIFARELQPITIGRFALAVALVELLKVFGLPGLYEAMLGRQDDTGRDQSAALAILLGAGCLLAPLHVGVLWGFLAATGGAPDGLEAWLLAAVALRIPLDLAVLQPQAELARRQAYARLAQRNLGANLGATALGLLAVFLGQPLIGLAGYTLLISVFSGLVTIIGTAAIRRPRWDPPQFALLRPEAISASLARGSATALSQMDQICVGALLGPVAIAHYNLGKRVEIAFTGVSNSFAQTLFQPDFAARPSASERLVGIQQGLALVTATCGAMAAGFVAVADLLVAALLGPLWMPAVAIMILLALGGFGRAVAVVHASMLSVSNRNREAFRIGAISGVVGLLVMLAAAPFGVAAVASVALLRVIVTCAAFGKVTIEALGGGAWRLHLAQVILPFALMLAAALGGRSLLVPLGSPAPSFAAMASATVAASAAAGLVGVAMLLRLRVGMRRLPA